MSKLLSWALLLCLTWACQPIESQQKDQKPLNLVFILTDEQRYDTSAPYGNHLIKTPHLNQLGEEAIVFERAYVTQPICSPARSTLLTGLYPHTSGIITNNIPLPEQINTLPEYLPEGKYHAAYYGKWHLGKELDAWQGFNERIATEDGYTASDTSCYSEYHYWLLEKGYTPDNERFGTFSRGYCNKLPYEHTKSKFTEIKGIEFLEKNKDQPFVLYLSFLEPHTPNFGPFDDLHDPALINLDSTYGAYVPKSEPLQHRLMRINEGLNKDMEHLKKEMAKYWGLVYQVDKSVGAIRQKIKSLGLEDNTILVFTSEHGKMMGKFGVSPKRMMYDASSRIPLFLKVPGIAKQKISYPVSHIDLVPTLLDAMENTVPNELQGKSLLPFLKEKHADNVFLEWFPTPNAHQRYSQCPEDIDRCMQVRSQQRRTLISPQGWKLVKSVRDADRSLLFNTYEDPLEINNLYYQEEYSTVRDSLVLLIKEWQQSVGDTVAL